MSGRLAGRRLLLWGVGTLVLAALLLVGLQHGGPKRGRPAPSLPREHISGPSATLSRLRGRPALITFWASYCGPCSKEAPELERFSHTSIGEGRLVAVDWSDSKTEAESFIDRHHWTFPVLRDDQGTVGLNYGLTALPATFVLDSHGRILEQLHGPQTVRTLTRALSAA